MAVAIVLAGGKGSRMNSDVAKQYIKIDSREIISYTLEAFERSEDIDEIVLVCGKDEETFCKEEIINKYGLAKVKKIVPGGKERYDSVYQGLLAVEEDYDGVVLVHDGARPCVTPEIIHNTFVGAKEYSACTVGVPVKDTIKIVDENGFSIDTPDRKFLYQIQTPQAFDYKTIVLAYEEMYKNPNHNITDDTMLVEQYLGIKSKVILGDYENIKITTEGDLEIAKKFLKKYIKSC